MVAFPAGRADRMYVFEAGAASAYQIRSGKAVLVWCGQAIDTPQGGWNPSSTVLRALTFPLRTVSGTLPLERALNVYLGFAGHLTTNTLNAAGKVTCARERFDEHEPRAAFQFDARDTCP